MKLAEDATGDGALSQREAIWPGLVADGEMYVEEPHFAEVDSSIKAVLRYNWFKFGFDVITLTMGNIFTGTLFLLVDLAPLVVTTASFFDVIEVLCGLNRSRCT